MTAIVPSLLGISLPVMLDLQSLVQYENPVILLSCAQTDS